MRMKLVKQCATYWPITYSNKGIVASGVLFSLARPLASEMWAGSLGGIIELFGCLVVMVKKIRNSH